MWTTNRLRARTALALLMTAAMLATGPGCASTDKAKKADKYDPDRKNVFDAEFDASKDRAPTAQTLYSMGRMLAARNQDEQALFVFDRCISEYPRFVPTYNDAAELKMRQDDLPAAMTYLTRGLEQSPNDPVLINNMGMCHMLKGEYEPALEQFRKAAELSPREERYRANAATALGLMGKYDESLDAFRNLMRPADAHYNVAVLAEARHDEAVATQHFIMAEKLEHKK